MQLRTLIKQKREKLGLTQYDLARLLGLGSLEYVRMVESGIRRFNIDTMPLLATTLNIPLSRLLRLHFREANVPKEVYELLFFRNEIAHKYEALEPDDREQIAHLINTLYEKIEASESEIQERQLA